MISWHPAQKRKIQSVFGAFVLTEVYQDERLLSTALTILRSEMQAPPPALGPPPSSISRPLEEEGESRVGVAPTANPPQSHQPSSVLTLADI